MLELSPLGLVDVYHQPDQARTGRVGQLSSCTGTCPDDPDFHPNLTFETGVPNTSIHDSEGVQSALRFHLHWW